MLLQVAADKRRWRFRASLPLRRDERQLAEQWAQLERAAIDGRTIQAGGCVKRAIYLAIMALLVSAPMVLADDPPNTLRDGVSRAADLQLARQGTYANGDLGSGSYDCAWEWEIGSGLAYRNTQAPSALGLLEAYEATGKVKYLISGREGCCLCGPTDDGAIRGRYVAAAVCPGSDVSG